MTIKLSSESGEQIVMLWKNFEMLTRLLVRSLMPYSPTAKLSSWLEYLRKVWSREVVASGVSSLQLELTLGGSARKPTLLVEALMLRTLTTESAEWLKHPEVLSLHTPTSKLLSPMEWVICLGLLATLLLVSLISIPLLLNLCGLT